MWRWRVPHQAPRPRWSAYPRQARQGSSWDSTAVFHAMVPRHRSSCLPQPCFVVLCLQGHCWCEADAGARAVGGDSRLSWGPVPLALIEGR